MVDSRPRFLGTTSSARTAPSWAAPFGSTASSSPSLAWRPTGFTGLDQFIRFRLLHAPDDVAASHRGCQCSGRLEARDATEPHPQGRLRPGVTMAQAHSELSVIASGPGTSVSGHEPESHGSPFGRSCRTESRRPRRCVTFLAMLTTLAGAVLFVACANVAGLLTSRAPVRAREIALRLAIGAGRRPSAPAADRRERARRHRSEACSVLASAMRRPLFRQAPNSDRSADRVPASDSIGARCSFSLIVALVSAVLFGLTPAIRSTQADLTSVMRATDAAGFGRRRRWGRAVLVGGQVAVSVVLLVVALFMYRGFNRLLSHGPGFRTDHLLMMSFDPSLVRYSEAQTQQFFEQVAESARSVAGVKSVALASSVPMRTDPAGGTAILPEGFQFPVGQESITALASSVDEHYFDAIGDLDSSRAAASARPTLPMRREWPS